MATVQLGELKIKSSPKTVGELLELIRDLEIRQAIYEQVVEHLGTFLSTDSYQPDKGVKSPGGGVIVESKISNIQEEIEQVIIDIDEQIKSLKKHGIIPAQEGERGKKQRTAKKEAKGDQATHIKEGGHAKK